MSDSSRDKPFEHITSTANDTVKLLRSLDRKKERQETGLFLAEGAHFAEEALINGWKPAYALADIAAIVRGEKGTIIGRQFESLTFHDPLGIPREAAQ